MAHETKAFQIAPGVTVQTSRLWDTNSVVVEGLGKPAFLVVDPGWYPDEIESLKKMVAEPTADTAVMFTHGDFDHVVGWEDFPQAALIAHPEAAKREPSAVEAQVAALDEKNGTARPRPYQYPPASRFTSPKSLHMGDETVLFFSAPGHQNDCLFTILPKRRILIAGDYLSNLEFPFIFHSLPRYQATLLLAKELCRTFEIQKEVPGHGQVAETPGDIEYRIATDLDYLERLETAVGDAKSQGLDAEKAVKRLAPFTFRDEPITTYAKYHAGNVRFLYGIPWDE